MLAVRGLRAGYGGALIVAGIDLAVQAGEIVTLIGQNGAGKSTLLKAIYNLVPQRAGTIVLEGRDVIALPSAALLSAGLAYMPQQHSVFPKLTVAENLRMGGYLLRNAKLVAERAANIERDFPILAERRGQARGQSFGWRAAHAGDRAHPDDGAKGHHAG